MNYPVNDFILQEKNGICSVPNKTDLRLKNYDDDDDDDYNDDDDDGGGGGAFIFIFNIMYLQALWEISLTN